MRKAQQYVQEGYRIVVDIDLEKFFDRINHDILMDRLAKRIADKAVLRLICRYLQTGVMTNGVVLEHFRRWKGDTVKIAVAPKALATFKPRMRLITARVAGRSMNQVAEGLQLYLPRWKAYFSLAQIPSTFRDLDSWIRRRLRAIQLKHWRREPTMYHGLFRLGATHELAALATGIGNRWWNCSRTGVQMVLTVTNFDTIEIPRLRDLNFRTAQCGPTCRVVWQGRSR